MKRDYPAKHGFIRKQIISLTPTLNRKINSLVPVLSDPDNDFLNPVLFNRKLDKDFKNPDISKYLNQAKYGHSSTN